MKEQIIQQILLHKRFFTALLIPAKKHEIPTWLATKFGAQFDRTVVNFFAKLNGFLYEEDAEQEYIEVMVGLRVDNKDPIAVFFEKHHKILQFFIENIENILPAADAFQRINMSELMSNFDKHEKDSDNRLKTKTHSHDSYFSLITNKIHSRQNSKEITENSIEEKLSNATTLKEIYDIFIVEKLNRYTVHSHRLKFLTNYSDSVTYKDKINSILQKARIISPISFYEFDLLKKMYHEGKKCSLPDNFEIAKLKEEALKFFLAQLERTKTISEINALFSELKDPENILRIERKNFLHPYGDTNSFIRAMIALVKRMLITPFSDNSDYNTLTSVADELNKHHPKYDCPDIKEWDSVKARLTQHLERLYRNIDNKGQSSNLDSSFNQIVQKNVVCRL